MPAAAFDALGTVLSLGALERAIQTSFPTIPAKQATLLWFYSAQRDFALSTLASTYRPIGSLFAGALPLVLRQFGVPQPSEDDTAAVVRALHDSMEPVGGAKRAFERLKEEGWDVMIVTNGGNKIIIDALHRGGALDLFKAPAGAGLEHSIISCDEIGVAKVHPKVYESAWAYLDKLSTLRGDASASTTMLASRWFVAAHAWDLMGARAAGPGKWKVAFVEEEEKIFNSAFSPAPEASGADLLQCVEAMIAREKEEGDRKF